MNNKKDDSNPLNYVDIDSRLQKFETPDQFADFFCKCAESQKKINNALAIVIKELISNDKFVKEELKTLAQEIINEDKSHFIIRCIEKVKYLISAAFGVACTLFVQWLLKILELS